MKYDQFLPITLVLVAAALACRLVRIGINDIKANLVEPAASSMRHPGMQAKRADLPFQKVGGKPGFDKAGYRESIVAQLSKPACLMLRSVKWSRPLSTAACKYLGAGFVMGPSMFKFARLKRLLVGFLLPVMICACTVVNDGTDRGRADQASKPLTSVVWKLLRFDSSASGESFSIDAPDRYTLILLSDRSYRVKADCNRMQGAYQLDDERISIHPGAATLAECGPDSKYAQYLRYLTTAKGFEIDEARHQFTLITDTGRLVFERGSETP